MAQISSSDQIQEKDPRKIARKYQLDLCKTAVEENTIVYLETGCGKTHIAVLLIYELGHLIRKPQKNVCVFLAPTVHLVRQQAMVVEHSTNFKVGSYVGNSKHLKNHLDWENEIEQYEVLVMTPQILLRNLEHCLIRMDRIALLIIDECHHAQTQNRHPYAQIMREFYNTCSTGRPRIFGMTASPVVGKGGGNQVDYSRSINSLEYLLDSKVRTVEDREELDSIVASPKMRIYFYGPVAKSILGIYPCYYSQLEEIKNQCMLMAREKFDDPIVRLKTVKLLWRVHESMIFCLETLGLWGGVEASQILPSDDNFKLSECKEESSSSNDSFLPYIYLKRAASLLNSDFMKDVTESGAFVPDVLEEPFFSKKLLLLIQILSTARLQENMKCIVFVKRIIIAQSLTSILKNLKSLGFWRCHSLVGFHSGLKKMSRKMMNGIVEKFRSGQVNLLVATNVAEEGLDIETCCLVIRFDLPETVTSFIQSRGRARMQQSEYAFLVERENQNELNLVSEFISNEERMNKEITSRTSRETFDGLQERRYKVDKTGANISAGSSVALLHHFCSKLPHDEDFTPKPLFVYVDDLNGTVCRIDLPPNAPFREVHSSPYPSKDEAKRDACLKACEQLHAAGCLSDYLLPEQDDMVLFEEADESDDSKDDDMREELHERLIPTALSGSWISSGNLVCLKLYFIKLEPIPEDRVYRSFGLFVKSALPKEAESMCVDLHLSHGRIVKTELIPIGTIEFDKNEITDAQNFQEMWLKIILDREELFSDFISLGKNSSVYCSWSTFYLLLPLTNAEGKIGVDWVTVKGCLSSPVFRLSADNDTTHNRVFHEIETLKFLNGVVNMSDVSDSIVVTPHNRLVFCVVDILSKINGYSLLKKSKSTTYIDHFKKLNIELLHPEQPLLKAKQLFNLRNLLHNRLQSNTEAQERVEHFVELPPEVCSLKVLHFSKEIGSSLSLLPSVMHRLENLLVAIELKDLLSESFSEGSTVTTNRILEALTTEKCLERFSLERLEVLGDAFLKYAVGRHLFLSHRSQDEGQLTKKRSNMVNNSHLRELAIKNNLQVTLWFCLAWVHGTMDKTEPKLRPLHSRLGLSRDGFSGSLELKRTPWWLWAGQEQLGPPRGTVGTYLKVYIRDQMFDPCLFHALGRSCTMICTKDTEKIIDASRGNQVINSINHCNVRCTKNHHWLHRKTIADVVEALIGAYIVDSGFKAAESFLRWIGIQVDFKVSDVSEIYIASESNTHVMDLIDVDRLENVLGYKFLHRGLLLQAFMHPSHNQRSGDCYQRLEFLGDAVLDYLITSYLYSVYPDLNPGQLTDLRSMAVNNNSFAHLAVSLSLSSFLISDSSSLSKAIDKFSDFVQLSDEEKDKVEEPSCPKVLGDLVESCIGAILLDAGFDLNCLWKIVLAFLQHLEKFSHKKLCPIRELRELCQSKKFGLSFPSSKNDRNTFSVKAEVDLNGSKITGHAVNISKKAAERMCSQDVLSKLKARGYRYETKSLEEIVQSSRREEAVLIGYDETPIKVDATDLIQLRQLQILNVEAASSSSGDDLVTTSKAVGNGLTAESKMFERDKGQSFETSRLRLYDDCLQTAVAPQLGSAKSHLYEMCSANFWNPPFFECFKAEGAPHMKVFTYKVVIKVEPVDPTVLECIGEPRLNKKAAMEHAAGGALWYLRHLGY